MPSESVRGSLPIIGIVGETGCQNGLDARRDAAFTDPSQLSGSCDHSFNNDREIWVSGSVADEEDGLPSGGPH
jgi:hypothetical protein